jgi:uncharacterized phage-associated protein
MTTAIEVASYIQTIDKSADKLKMMKLLYYIQSWCLVWTGKPMFSDDIESWEFGPVVPDVFYAYPHKKNNVVIPLTNSLTNEQIDIITSVVNVFKNTRGTEMIDLTHSEQPWQNAIKSNYKNEKISEIDMVKFFNKLLITDKNNKYIPIQPLSLKENIDLDKMGEFEESVQQEWDKALKILA